jgi:hypothetical protein
MFLNANSGAKFAEDYAKKQRILKARALAKAKGGVIADADSPSKKPARKGSFEQSETTTTSTWLSDRNDLRTHAIANVQDTITKQAERKGLLSTTLERLVEVAQARSECSNERGMYRFTHVPAWKRRRRLYYALKQTYK